MNHRHVPSRMPHRLALTAAVSTALIAVAAPASAARLEAGRYQDSGSVLVDWCDGLDLEYSWDVSGSYHAVSNGPDRLPHYRDSASGTDRFTNVATGRTVTVVWNVNSRDIAVTDNGDGTLTYLVQGAGGERWYDADGNLALLDPGLTRWELVIDHGGTPSDPSDDEVVEHLPVVKGSTGRNDTEGLDFCDSIASATT